MAIHDRYARRTPFELEFAGELAEAHFPRIREQVEARGLEAADPVSLLQLPAAAEALDEIMEPPASPAVMEPYGSLLYHAYQFWRHEQPLFLLSTDVARWLVDAAPELSDWTLALAASAGYVQLPQHLFWARAVEGGPAESIDGFFWSRVGATGIAGLLVLGLRTDRLGVSAVPLGPLRLDELRELAGASAREPGRDFESTLPGGELERLYSVDTMGEAIKLVARTLWYMKVYPQAVTREPPAEATPGEPSASRLAFSRVSLIQGL